MTRADIERVARRALEELPGELQEVALKRAVGRKVIAWSTLRVSELWRVYGSARVVSLIAEVMP